MSDLGNKAIMAQNIQRLMEQSGKTRTQVCDDLGIKYTTFTDWVNAKTYPRIDKIELMANYFGVSKADLVESHNAPMEDEQKKRLDQLTDEINKQKLFLQTAADSTYSFFLKMRALVGSDKQTPRDIFFRENSEITQIQEEIEELIVRFMETATPEGKADFLLRLDQIGREFHRQMDSIKPHNHDIYSQYLPPPPQSAPAPQEGKDTAPTPDALEMPPEDKK